MSSNKLAVKLSFIYILLYAAIASFLPFLTPYLQQRGLSYTQIGVAFAVNSIVAVISQPLWGFLTDKYFNKRLTLIILILASSVLIYSFIFAGSFFFIILSITLIIGFQSATMPISDAYTYDIINQHRQIQYGRIRLMGSFGFAVGALVVGYIIEVFGMNISYFIYSGLMLLGAYLVYTIDFQPIASERKANLTDFVNLVRDKKFSIFMVSIVIMNVALGVSNTYIYVLVEETGGDVSKLGVLLFAVAMSELPTFYYGNKILKKFGELKIYVVGVSLFALRMFLNSLLDTYQLVILVQFMQSVTFAFYLIAALQYINNITSNEIKTSAMTFFAAMSGVGALIGNMGGGVLLEHISIFSLYRISSYVAISSLIFVVILKAHSRKKEVQNSQVI
ncbi:MFS transporter [Alkalicella caledoniensis]|uniref:MFS transporter n=1 Tax=Alkalicella caledoniensis TaxID=2731377 RepID=A0A7G9W5L9_ALKCA|nr:MFS transporter [Alkalicella caledoniensis]QNO13981.1 MFS transporter [Alkalicella caledoniensis]